MPLFSNLTFLIVTLSLSTLLLSVPKTIPPVIVLPLPSIVMFLPSLETLTASSVLASNFTVSSDSAAAIASAIVWNLAPSSI